MMHFSKSIFYILIDIRLAYDRIWCKVNACSDEVIHYKSFPLLEGEIIYLRSHEVSDPRSTP